MQNHAAEIKIRAERRAGEMLSVNPDIHPGGDRKSSLHDERMKLSDLGISETQSHRWQLEAEALALHDRVIPGIIARS